MYFPNLKSVKTTAEIMSRHTGEKKYIGIIPQNDSDLSEARKQLGKYFRDIWKDELQALEIELSVTENNYHEKIAQHMRYRFMRRY